MIDEQLRIDSKHPVKQLFVIVIRLLPKRASGDIPHGEEPLFFQFLRISAPHSPEIGQRAVRPESPATAHLIQIRDPYSVLIRLGVLCPDIHCHLAQIQIRPDPCRSRDPHGLLDIQDDCPGKFLRSHLIRIQIGCYIHENLVDRVHMHILRSNVF